MKRRRICIVTFFIIFGTIGTQGLSGSDAEEIGNNVVLISRFFKENNPL